MATLYYNAAVDSNWGTLGNWWTSAAFTTQASALPTSSDSVVLSTTCNTNSGSAPTVVNFTLNDGYITIAFTVTGNATFNYSSINGGGPVTGNVTFNDSSQNYGTVSGNATFNDNASNNGSGNVTGTATFNDSSPNYGTVTNGTFNDNSSNRNTVTGTATFSLSSASTQIVGGYDGSYGSVAFAYEKGINGSSILGIV